MRLGHNRLSNDEKDNLFHKMVKGLSKHSNTIRNTLLNLIVESLPFVQIPDDPKERDDIFSDIINNETDKSIILSYFLDILFYIPNIQIVPGITYESLKIINETIRQCKIDINKQKENIIMFLSKRIFKLEEILIHLIVGSCMIENNNDVYYIYILFFYFFNVFNR